MEQLIWAIIILIFIIFTALRNRARNRPDTLTSRPDNTEYKRSEERDRLNRYMEELLGIEIQETRPQIRVKREVPETVKREVKPKPEPETKRKIGQFKSPLVKKHKKEMKSTFPEIRDICHARFSWGNLSKKDLPKAIILSEIIGPPISRRKDRRLF